MDDADSKQTLAHIAEQSYDCYKKLFNNFRKNSSRITLIKMEKLKKKIVQRIYFIQQIAVFLSTCIVETESSVPEVYWEETRLKSSGMQYVSSLESQLSSEI